MLGISTTNARVGGFRGGILADSKTIYNRIIADGGVSNLTRLNFFVKGLKAIYGDLANVPVCYDAHWIGYKLGSGTGATAGQAAAKLYSLTVAGDAVQTTAASQPLLLSHNGVNNYFYCSGVAGNYCSTTTSKTFTNFTFNTKFNINTSLAAASEILGRDFVVRMNTAKTIDIISSGAVIAVTTTPFTYTDNTDFWIRITRVGTTLKVFSSTDGTNYNQKDSDFTVGSGSITITNLNVAGFGASGAAFNPFGKIYYVTIDGILDFNPASYNAATSQTAWTSATGEVWTINTGTATTGYKGCLVSRNIVQGDGVDDKLVSGAITSYQYVSRYVALTQYTSQANKRFLCGTSTGHMIYRSGGNVKGIFNGTFLGVNGSIDNKLQVYTQNYNGVTSSSLVDNANLVSGDTGSISSTSMCLFASDLGEFANGNLNTIIQALNVDTANNTATYNLLKNLNNL
jgi:hypothetical protein